MRYADLHIHTVHSDGTMTVKEVIETALSQNVGLIAVTDHEMLSGSRELMTLSKDYPITVLSGCELSAMFEGVYLHILGYGVDLDDPRLVETADCCRRTLDKMSDDLIGLLSKQDCRVSASEYASYERNIRNGGWKGIDYLAHKGVVPYPMAGAKLYGQYGVTYEKAGFPSLSEVVSAIHGAGGYAVVAHAFLADTPDVPRIIGRLFDAGIDGAECYYPKHDEAQTQTLLALCEAHNAIVTAGSDCHGTFTNAEIGQTRTDAAVLHLKGLLKGGEPHGI